MVRSGQHGELPGRPAAVAAQPPRAHYVKARARAPILRWRPTAVFHGPRCVARFDDEGRHRPDAPLTCASATSTSRSGRRLRRWPTAIRPRLRAMSRNGRSGRRNGSRSNQETGPCCGPVSSRRPPIGAVPGRRVHRFQSGQVKSQKRTSDVLPKPDNLISYRQPAGLQYPPGGRKAPQPRRTRRCSRPGKPVAAPSSG